MKITKSKDGTVLAYDVYGTGPALIYITGAICFREFKPVIADAKVFSKEFTVYTYDRRGRGDSGDTGPYAVEREIEDIEAIIDCAGGSAFLYGHSSGAVLALEAALRIPSKVSKVIMFDAPYVANEKEKLEYVQFRSDVVRSIQEKENKKALKKFLFFIGMPKIFFYFLPLMGGWKKMKALAPTLEYDIILTSDLPPLTRVTQAKVPIHIMYGEKNPPGISDVAEQLGKAIPGSKLTALPSESHMVSAKVLLPFMTSFFKG